MKRLGTILLILSAVAVLAAVWSPVGHWGQWLVTALILTVFGIACIGHADNRAAANTSTRTGPEAGPGPRRRP